jgi:dolichol-phosphate mannosyltransferase
MKKAVIVVPTYNEVGNISQLIHSVFQVAKTIEQWEIELLIVDSSSPDGTAQTVRELQKTYDDLHIIETPKEGLGRAYVNGFSYALEHLRPFVIFEMDADLSHNPNYIPHFLKKIEQGADFVIGSRYIKGGSIPANWDYIGRFFLCVPIFLCDLVL